MWCQCRLVSGTAWLEFLKLKLLCRYLLREMLHRLDTGNIFLFSLKHQSLEAGKGNLVSIVMCEVSKLECKTFINIRSDTTINSLYIGGRTIINFHPEMLKRFPVFDKTILNITGHCWLNCTINCFHVVCIIVKNKNTKELTQKFHKRVVCTKHSLDWLYLFNSEKIVSQKSICRNMVSDNCNQD